MANLIASALCFVVLHRAVSGSPLRAILVGHIGETAYARFFMLASVASLGWLGVAYAGTATAKWTTDPWALSRGVAWLELLLQPMAVLLVVTGLTTPNPGTFRQETVVDEPVRGMLRVTRHPFLWGIAVLAIGHLVASPSPRNVVLFGSLAFVALSGTRSIDRKRRRSLGSRWAAFESQTSNVPFAAIFSGRQRFVLREIVWWVPVLAVVLSVLAGTIHPLLFGKSVLP